MTIYSMSLLPGGHTHQLGSQKQRIPIMDALSVPTPRGHPSCKLPAEPTEVMVPTLRSSFSPAYAIHRGPSPQEHQALKSLFPGKPWWHALLLLQETDFTQQAHTELYLTGDWQGTKPYSQRPDEFPEAKNSRSS